MLKFLASARKCAFLIPFAFLFLFVTFAHAQSGAVIPQGGAGHADQASCIILKRMGPADEVTSHMYSFGIRGKQFQYVEGKLPEGAPFHGRLTDHDVRNLQARGAEVIVLEAHYTADELKQARADCRGETGKTPTQSEAKAAPAEASVETVKADPPAASQSAVSKSDPPAPAPAASVAPASAAQLEISSNPAGADIEVDGDFVGNTPSSISLAPGEHEITITKSGFTNWKRKIKVSTGNIKINAELAPETKP